MEIALWIGIGIIAALAVVAGFFARRDLLARGGGTIEVSLRLSTWAKGRGWAPGFARFDRDELRWYRMFSLLGPRRTLSRRRLAVLGRRAPAGPERLVLPESWVILRCDADQGPVEIAMAEPAMTGFLSWLEAAPPSSGGRPERQPRGRGDGRRGDSARG